MESIGLRRRNGDSPSTSEEWDPEDPPAMGELPEDAPPQAPKAKRGRKPNARRTAEDIAAAQEAAAKKKDNERAKLTADIVGLIAIPNTIIAAVPPLSEDALNPTEHIQLAHAIALYAESDARTKRLIRQAVSKSAIAALVGTLAAIALPRLARHGLLPQGVADRMRELMQVGAPADEAA